VYKIIALITLLTLLTLPVVIEGSIASQLSRGDKIVYQIIYYDAYSQPSRIEYYEVTITDNYMSTNVYFDIEVKYIGLNGVKTSVRKGLKDFELYQFIPLIIGFGYVTSDKYQLSIPMPIRKLNEPYDQSSPTSLKVLDLIKISQGVEKVYIGGSTIELNIIRMGRNETDYRYEALVDSSNGLLVELTIRDKGNNVYCIIRLDYYSNYHHVKNFENFETTSSVHNTVQNPLPVIILLFIAIVVMSIIATRIK